MQPLWTKKNHATSRDKKVHNLWDKKSLNLSGQKNHSQNCYKWHQLHPNGSKYVRIGPNRSKFVQTFPKGTKWVQMGQLGPNRSKWFQISLQGSKVGVQNYHELNQMAFKPRSPGSCIKSKWTRRRPPCVFGARRVQQIVSVLNLRK